MKLTLPMMAVLSAALLPLVAPVTAHAQSLADVARQQRAERQNTRQPRVYTNDDVESPDTQIIQGKAAEEEEASAPAADAKAGDAKPGDAKAGDTKPGDAKTTDGKPAEGADAEASAKKTPAKKSSADAAAAIERTDEAEDNSEAKTSAKKAVQREKDIVARTKEVEDRYINRIKRLREDLDKARLQLAKTQSDQIESTRSYHNTAGMTPTHSEYDAEQRGFIEKLAEQQDLIKGLEQQVADAQEDARHAGVPHPYDY
jgi:hypothetical protein